MSPLLLELLIIILLILINGVLAMSEIAVVSARKARLQQRANTGDSRAKAALALASEPNLFLSTVQIGITLVGILAGAFGGATLAEELAAYLADVPWLGQYNEAAGVGIVVMGVTYLSLVVGELVPKRLGLNQPEQIAAAVAGPMRLLSVVAAPLVRLLSLSTEGIIRLLGVRPSTEPPVTEEEIKVLLEQGTQAGIFAEAEQDMVTGIFNLGDQRASALMTPRTEIAWLDLAASPAEVGQKITVSPYSRFPVCAGSLDNILGVVRAKDLLARSLAGQPLDLKAVMQPPLFVPESLPAARVLELFKQTGSHLALVLDEYGGTQGLVTLHDILEAIVGDIEPAAMQAVRRQDGSWLLDGALPIAEFKELFGLEPLPGEARGYYQTLGGFVMTVMKRVPAAGDSFEWGGLRLEVVDMDGRRVDKVLVVAQNLGS